VSQPAPAALEAASSGSAAPLPGTKRIAFPVAPRDPDAAPGPSEGGSETPATKHIVFPARAGEARREALDEIESPDAPAVQRSEPPLSHAEPRSVRSGSTAALLSAGRTAGLTVAAAAASFALVSVVRGWLGPGDAPEPAAASAEAAGEMAAPAAAGSVAAPAVAAKATAPRSPAKEVVRQFKTEDLPLPPGIVVSAARGMLEVDTGERNSMIYVAGTFVGRGPVRRIELDPGPHRVVARLGSEELECEATVTKGRRIRLSLASSQ
jgi:hypothetical protein